MLITLPFIAYTDASNCGLSAVLALEQDGFEPKSNDANYSSFKLAMKWPIVEKFKEYLWGVKITVATDNNPLVHPKTAALWAVDQRWVAQLANFIYIIKSRPGKDNINADFLSSPSAVSTAACQVGDRPVSVVETQSCMTAGLGTQNDGRGCKLRTLPSLR